MGVFFIKNVKDCFVKLKKKFKKNQSQDKCNFEQCKYCKNKPIVNEFNLSNLQIGDCAKITKYNNSLNDGTKRRMLELGFIIGEKIKLINKSMCGNVFLFEINGYMLSVRKEVIINILCGDCNE